MLSSKAAPETGAAACSAPRSLLPAPRHPSLCRDCFGPRLQTPRLSVSHDASSRGDHHLHKVIKSFLNSSTLPWTVYMIHPSKGFCAICILIFQTSHLPPACLDVMHNAVSCHHVHRFFFIILPSLAHLWERLKNPPG